MQLALGLIFSDDSKGRGSFNRDFLIAGVFLGLSFYTYFASRGIPVILIVTTVYILLFHRIMLKQRLLVCSTHVWRSGSHCIAPFGDSFATT